MWSVHASPKELETARTQAMQQSRELQAAKAATSDCQERLHTADNQAATQIEELQTALQAAKACFLGPVSA